MTVTRNGSVGFMAVDEEEGQAMAKTKCTELLGSSARLASVVSVGVLSKMMEAVVTEFSKEKVCDKPKTDMSKIKPRKHYVWNTFI